MANWTNLKTAIANVIKTNGHQEITGQLLQNVLNNIVSSVGANATFVGIATPITNPGTPDGPVFYIAGEGTYVYFNNITIDKGQLCILKWNNESWSKELMTEVNSYASISGVLNLTSSTCISSLPSMKENELRLYIAGDSNGDYPAKNRDKYVKVNDTVKVANFLNTDSSLYINVGDIIAVIGYKTLLGITKVCRVIPLNDAKPGLTDGIMTKGDKSLLTSLSTNVVELQDIIDTRLALKSYSESNMNNALEPGIYPWCTLGRPTGSTGAYTCIVQKSFDVDWGSYYTIEQTAYGRQDELGQVYKRIIFQKNDGSDTQYGEWILVSGVEPIIYEVYPEHFGRNTVVETTEEVYDKLYRIGTLQDRTTIPYIRVSWDEHVLYFTGRPNFSDLHIGADRLVWISYGIGFHILQLYKREDDDKPVFELTQKII